MKGEFAAYNARMVRGEPTLEPRLADVPVRMPFPVARHQGSIYENQKGTGRRFFDTYGNAEGAIATS
jgi:hypothetical protein